MITFKGFCTFFGPHQTLTLVNLPSQNHTPYLLCNLFVIEIYLFVTEFVKEYKWELLPDLLKVLSRALIESVTDIFFLYLDLDLDLDF